MTRGIRKLDFYYAEPVIKVVQLMSVTSRELHIQHGSSSKFKYFKSQLTEKKILLKKKPECHFYKSLQENMAEIYKQRVFILSS
jgi:hypothetical protein